MAGIQLGRDKRPAGIRLRIRQMLSLLVFYEVRSTSTNTNTRGGRVSSELGWREWIFGPVSAPRPIVLCVSRRRGRRVLGLVVGSSCTPVPAGLPPQLSSFHSPTTSNSRHRGKTNRQSSSGASRLASASLLALRNQHLFIWSTSKLIRQWFPASSYIGDWPRWENIGPDPGQVGLLVLFEACLSTCATRRLFYLSNSQG